MTMLLARRRWLSMAVLVSAVATMDANAAEVAAAAQSAAQKATVSTAAMPAAGAAAKHKSVAANVRLQTDVITGSSELPKVLYILPWRAASAATGLDAAPEASDQQLFQSLDPDAHGRLLHYRRLLGETVAEVK